MDKRLCLHCGQIVTQTYKQDGKIKNYVFKEMLKHIGDKHSQMIFSKFVQLDNNNKPIPIEQ